MDTERLWLPGAGNGRDIGGLLYNGHRVSNDEELWRRLVVIAARHYDSI